MCLRIYRRVYLWKKAYINLFSCKLAVNWMYKSSKFFCTQRFEIYTLVHCSLLNVEWVCTFDFFLPFHSKTRIFRILSRNYQAIVHYTLIQCMLFMQESNNVSEFHVSQPDFQSTFFVRLAFSLFSRFNVNKMVLLSSHALAALLFTSIHGT